MIPSPSELFAPIPFIRRSAQLPKRLHPYHGDITATVLMNRINVFIQKFGNTIKSHRSSLVVKRTPRRARTRFPRPIAVGPLNSPTSSYALQLKEPLLNSKLSLFEKPPSVDDLLSYNFELRPLSDHRAGTSHRTEDGSLTFCSVSSYVTRSHSIFTSCLTSAIPEKSSSVCSDLLHKMSLGALVRNLQTEGQRSQWTGLYVVAAAAPARTVRTGRVN